MTQGPGPQDPQNPFGQPDQPAPGQTPPPPGQVPPPPPPPPGGGYPPQGGQQYPGQTPPPPPPAASGQVPPPPPPPPAGGYPPQGGQQYPGQTPPPPPPPPGQASGDSAAIAAIKHGWDLFTKNIAPFLISMIIWAVVFGLVYALMFGAILLPALGGSRSQGAFFALGSIGFVGIFLLVFVMIVLAMLAQAGFVNAALKAHDTGKAEIGDFFKFRNIGQVLIYGVVVGLANALLSFTGIGSIIVGALTLFGMFLIVDRNMGFWDAIMGSAKLFLNNFAQSAILFVLVMVLVGIGAAICGLGVLVAGPVAILAIATYYRTLGEIPTDFKVG